MKKFVDDVKKIGYHLLGNQAQAVVGELAEPVREQDGKKKITWFLRYITCLIVHLKLARENTSDLLKYWS